MKDRYLVRKKAGFRSEEDALLKTLQNIVGDELSSLELYQVYDAFGGTQEELTVLAQQILMDPTVDDLWTQSSLHPEEMKGKKLFAGPLDGQYDPRSDAASQCLALHFPEHNVEIYTGQLYVFNENLSDDAFAKIERFLVNPVEREVKDLSKLANPQENKPEPVEVFAGFCELDQLALEAWHKEHRLAMSIDDLKLIQDYFKEEKRDPNDVEIKVLDTYWSDHCRHSTFETALTDIEVASGIHKKHLQELLKDYEDVREESGRADKPKTLMDLATIVARDMRRKGELDRQEVSDEVNACSVYVDVKTEDGVEPWLLMFKNETHNHPTEIEPFGGANTCLGGAIRDPLSGRAYVYQALRLTGAGNILAPRSETLPNKLPQVDITTRAADGYASYGNQIGLATTKVREFYHPGYTAKRLELGAVVAATPVDHVKREAPVKGDVILLLGGRTGRDGIGGATGSSVAHDETSLRRSGAEVQRGNPVEERKILRFFRDPKVTRLIKKCNDFGAGGVSVAIGELADSLDIDLSAVPLKYDGLGACEIAISESQERMAVLVAAKDVETFKQLALEENLEVTDVARVTDTGRLRMYYKNEKVLDLARSFLDENGAPREAKAIVPSANHHHMDALELTKDGMLFDLQKPNHGSQRGLTEQFDSSIGCSTVLWPYGGVYQNSEESVSMQTLPVPGGTTTASVMSYGYSPYLADESPYLMGAYSVVEALSALVAAGGTLDDCYLTCQEYFRRLDQNPEAWGEVVAALLGLFEAQRAFGTASIGGKDSMSGTYEDINVPPTLVSFAITTLDTSEAISACLPKEDGYLYYLPHQAKEGGRPDYEALNRHFKAYEALAKDGKILAGNAVRLGGVWPTVAKMVLGNQVGLVFTDKGIRALGDRSLGGLIFMTKDKLTDDELVLMAEVKAEADVQVGNMTFTHQELQEALEKVNSAVFPAVSGKGGELPDFAKEVKESKTFDIPQNSDQASSTEVHVLLPVFPGGNSELDTAAAFKAAGATVEEVLFKNIKPELTAQNQDVFLQRLKDSDIVVFSGGFSFGDEPDGAAKFMVNFLQTKEVKAALEAFLERDGLILGICNGFQALVKSGFLPNVKPEHGPQEMTLFHNKQMRHVSRIARTRVVTNDSPWLWNFKAGEIQTVAVSHGEGRLLVPEETAKELFANGQVAYQYVDLNGEPSLDAPWNPNGSSYAIEGLLSPCGKILGKMGHAERYRPGLMQNIPGMKEQKIFENAVQWVKHHKAQVSHEA